METVINWSNIINAVLFSVVGLSILSISFYVFDRLTPGHLWTEIGDKKNLPVAVVVAAFTLAMAIIVASAIH